MKNKKQIMEERIFETNGPAMVYTNIERALSAIERGDLNLAKEILVDTQPISGRVVEWLKRLNEAKCKPTEGLMWSDKW